MRRRVGWTRRRAGRTAGRWWGGRRCCPGSRAARVLAPVPLVPLVAPVLLVAPLAVALVLVALGVAAPGPDGEADPDGGADGSADAPPAPSTVAVTSNDAPNSPAAVPRADAPTQPLLAPTRPLS